MTVKFCGRIWSWSSKRSFQGERITKILLYGNILVTILGILSESLGLVFVSVLKWGASSEKTLLDCHRLFAVPGGIRTKWPTGTRTPLYRINHWSNRLQPFENQIKNIKWKTLLEIWKYFNFGDFILWEWFIHLLLICQNISQSDA